MLNFKLQTKKSPQAPKSIKHLLLRSLFSSILVFFIILSFMLIWLTQKAASSIILNNARETVQVLAKQGAFALLTDSIENADNALVQVKAFPDVVGAGLISQSGEVLIWQGVHAGKTHFTGQNWANHQSKEVVYDTNDYWHISAKVLVSAETGEFDLHDSTQEIIGYAIVSFSKKSLQAINYELFLTVSIASLFVLFALPLVIVVVTRRLLAPLKALSDVMNENHNLGDHKQAKEEGAKEIQLMARTFNTLMHTLNQQDTKLKNHRDRLEAKVKLRTKELVIARDAALSSNRLKSEFLANVTHELRSPIQSIIGYIELIKEEVENEGLFDLLRDLDKVTRNAERLHALINSILDLSKIEAGKMEINKQQTSISQLLSDLETATSPLAKHNNNSFIVDNKCSTSDVMLDKEKTLQILINLVSNALKFTNSGQVTLVINKSSKKIVFEVIDNGIGIPEGKLDSIFNQFQQVDGSESRKFGGTGLGLAISKQFCEMMGGKITVKSELGQGSTFSLALPQ